MTRQPKIPMSPAELPQQRIHEVIDLPARPQPFDSVVGYGQFPKGSVAKKAPQNMTYLGQVEWAWSPAHNRLDAYFLNRGRTHWSLWSRYWDDNWSNWADIAVGVVPLAGIMQREAAIYLLLELWRHEATENGLDEFHWINEVEFLSVPDFSAIAREVWSV